MASSAARAREYLTPGDEGATDPRADGDQKERIASLTGTEHRLTEAVRVHVIESAGSHLELGVESAGKIRSRPSGECVGCGGYHASSAVNHTRRGNPDSGERRSVSIGALKGFVSDVDRCGYHSIGALACRSGRRSHGPEVWSTFTLESHDGRVDLGPAEVDGEHSR